MGNLVIFLTDSPFHHESVERAYRIAKAALKKNHNVQLFLMMDGVYNPLITQSGEPFKLPSVSEQITELIDEGAKVSGCRVCMELRGIKSELVPQGFIIGGLADFSDMISNADVVINFAG